MHQLWCIENYPPFIENYGPPPYRKLQPLISAFIESSIFGRRFKVSVLRRPIKLFSPLWSKFIERLSWKSYQFSWVHKAMMLCNDNFAFRWTDDSLWWPYHVCSDSRGKKLTGFLIGTGGMSLLLQKLYYYSYYILHVLCKCMIQFLFLQLSLPSGL